MLTLVTVEKQYARSRTKALADVSLSFQDAEHVLIVGPNGAGKSTLLSLILGISSPSSGRLEWRQGVAPRIGYAPERPSLMHHASAGELFDLWSGDADWIRQCIAALGLNPILGRRTEELSKGEAQRLSLGLAFVADTPLVVLDEPYEGLDPLIRPVVRGFIMTAIEARGRTVMASTHRLEEVSAPFQRVIVMNQGRIIQDVAMSQLEELSSGFVAVLPPNAPVDEIERAAGRNAERVYKVRGVYRGMPAVLVGPFTVPPPAIVTNPMDLETLLQLWLQQEIA